MTSSDLTELERLHAASFGWALSCCRRDHAEAEEVLQIVYLKILEGKAVFRGESSLKTWLFAVIRKTAISERRKHMLRATKAGPRSTNDEPDAAFERSETQERFQRALQTLPARQREALHLVFYEDLSLREAADVMNISIGSARQHYERGKKHLREILARAGDQRKVNYGVSWKRKANPGVVL